MQVTKYAVYRSDCTLAQSEFSFCDSSYISRALFADEPDSEVLLALKKVCEERWPMFVFAIVPVTRYE